MGLAGARSGVENPVGKGRGIVGVCDRAGRRSVTRLQRKVAVTGESPPCCALAAEVLHSPCVKTELNCRTSSIGADRPRRPIPITRRRLFHDRRMRLRCKRRVAREPLMRGPEPSPLPTRFSNPPPARPQQEQRPWELRLPRRAQACAAAHAEPLGRRGGQIPGHPAPERAAVDHRHGDEPPAAVERDRRAAGEWTRVPRPASPAAAACRRQCGCRTGRVRTRWPAGTASGPRAPAASEVPRRRRGPARPRAGTPSRRPR